VHRIWDGMCARLVCLYGVTNLLQSNRDVMEISEEIRIDSDLVFIIKHFDLYGVTKVHCSGLVNIGHN